MSNAAPSPHPLGRVQRLAAALQPARMRLALGLSLALLAPLLAPTPVEADTVSATVVYNVAAATVGGVSCTNGTGFDGQVSMTNVDAIISPYGERMNYSVRHMNVLNQVVSSTNAQTPLVRAAATFTYTYNGGNINGPAISGIDYYGQVIVAQQTTNNNGTNWANTGTSFTRTGASRRYDESVPSNVTWTNKSVDAPKSNGRAVVRFTLNATDSGCLGTVTWRDGFGNTFQDPTHSSSSYAVTDFYDAGPGTNDGVGSVCTGSNSFAASITEVRDQIGNIGNPSASTTWSWNGACVGIVTLPRPSYGWNPSGVTVSASSLSTVSAATTSTSPARVGPAYSVSGASLTVEGAASYTASNVGTIGANNQQPSCAGGGTNVKYYVNGSQTSSWTCPWTMTPFNLSNLSWARKGSTTNTWVYTGSLQGPGDAGVGFWCRGTNGSTSTTFWNGDASGNGWNWPTGVFVMNPTNRASAVGDYTASCSVNQSNTNITNNNITGTGVSQEPIGNWSITLNSQTTALSATATTLAYGTNGVQNTPTVTLAGGNGSGAYQFDLAAQPTPSVCTASNVSGATATLTFLSGSPGQACQVRARRLGDSNYNPTAWTNITVNSGGFTTVQKGSQAAISAGAIRVGTLAYGLRGSTSATWVADTSTGAAEHRAAYRLGGETGSGTAACAASPWSNDCPYAGSFPNTTFEAGGGGAWTAAGSSSLVTIRTNAARAANTLCTASASGGNLYATYLAGSPTLPDGQGGECWLSVGRAGDANWAALAPALVQITEAGTGNVLIRKGERQPRVAADSFLYGIDGVRLNDRLVAPRGVLTVSSTPCPINTFKRTPAEAGACGLGEGSSSVATLSTEPTPRGGSSNGWFNACSVTGGRLVIEEITAPTDPRACWVRASVPADTNWLAWPHETGYSGNASVEVVGRNGPLGTEAYTDMTQKGTQAPLVASTIDVLDAGATSSVASDSPRTVFNFATALEGFSGTPGADANYVASSTMTNAAGSGLLASKPAGLVNGDQLVATLAASAVPYVRGISTLASGTSSLSITPTTNGVGDIVLVFVESTYTNTAISTPTATGVTFAAVGTAGGGTIGGTNNAAGAARLAVWWARVASGSVGTISVTQASATQMTAYAVVVSNAASSPIGAVIGPTGVAANATATFDAITTTADDSLVFTALATDADAAASQVSNTGTAGNLTNYNLLAGGGTTTGSGGGLALAAGAIGLAGSTGSPTLPLASSQAHVRTAFEIKAVGTVSLAPSQPSEWTTLVAPTRVGPLWTALYTKTAGAGDPATFNFVTGAGGAVVSGVIIDAFRGVDIVNPTLGAGTTSSQSATINSPALSPDRDDMLRLATGVTLTPGSWTIPTGFTSNASLNQAPGVAGDFGIALYSSRLQLASAAAQSAVSASAIATDATSKGYSGSGFSLLLRPASANIMSRDTVYLADGGTPGSLRTSIQPSSSNGAQPFWIWTGTFAELGVPADATLVSLTLNAKSKAVGAFGASSTIAMWDYIVGGNVTNLSGGRAVSSADAGFISTGNLTTSLSGRAPSDSFSLRVTDTLFPAVSGSTGIDVYHDSVTVTVNYSLPPGADSCPGSGCRLLYGIDGTVAAYSLVFSGGSAGASGLDTPALTVSAPSPSACTATQVNPLGGGSDPTLAIARPASVSSVTGCRLTVAAQTDAYWQAGTSLTTLLGYVVKGRIDVAPTVGTGETGKGDIVPNCLNTSSPTLSCDALIGASGVLEAKSSITPYLGAALSMSSLADPANSALACAVPATIPGATLTASGSERRAFYQIPSDPETTPGGTICYVEANWLESTLWQAGPTSDPIGVFAIGSAAQYPIGLLVSGIAVDDYDTVNYGGTPPVRRALDLSGGSGTGAIGFANDPVAGDPSVCQVYSLVGGAYEIELRAPGFCTISAWKSEDASFNRIDATFIFEVVQDDQEDPTLGGALLGLSGTLMTDSTVTLVVSGGAGGGSFDPTLTFGAGCPVGIDSSRTSQTLGASPQANYQVTVPAGSAGLTCEVSFGRDGDTRYAPATGSSNLLIAKRETSVTIAAQSAATTTSGPRTVTVTIVGSSGALSVAAPTAGGTICRPSGAVTRTVDADTNEASFTLIFPGSSGSCGITVNVAADDDFGSGSASSSFEVAKSDQTITFDPIADRALSEARVFTVSTQASSGLTPSLASSTTGVCTVGASPSGTAPGPYDYTVTLVGVTGTCTLTASQAGNGTYEAASPVIRSFAVTQPAPSSLDLLASSDSGRFDNDNITNAAVLEIAGDVNVSSGFGALPAEGLRVTVKAELQCGPNSGTPVASCLAAPTSWEATVALLGATNSATSEWLYEFDGLPEGVYQVQAQTRTWNAGLVNPAFDSPWSPPLEIRVDRTAPGPAIPSGLAMTSGEPGNLRTFLNGFPQVFYDPAGVVGNGGQMALTFEADDGISAVDRLFVADPDPANAPSLSEAGEIGLEPSSVSGLEAIRAANFGLPLTFSSANVGSYLIIQGRDLAGNRCESSACELRLTFTPDGVAPTAIFKSGDGTSFGPLVTIYRSVLSYVLRTTLIDKGNSTGPTPLD